MTRSRDTADTQDNSGGVLPPFVAGKNKIINGDFGVWQRGTTFNDIGTAAYSADRWLFQKSGTQTANITRQAFTPGAAPVAGYEGNYFLRLEISAYTSGAVFIGQLIENVTTFAGQTVTVSFYARATSALTSAVMVLQNFGSGGSASVETVGGSFNFTTSWARYTHTVAVPSISGKTIGANSYVEVQILRSSPTATNTIELWGAQIEAGSVATPFTTASGSIGGELALCQRYYWRETAGTTYTYHAMGYATNTTNAVFLVKHPVRMRVVPTSVDYASLAIDLYGITNYAFTTLALVSTVNGIDVTLVEVSGATGLTANRAYGLAGNNSASNYIGFSAELAP